LTREQLEDIVGRIRDVLWQDPVTGALDPDRSWDVATIEWVSGVLEDAGIKPDPVGPASATADGPSIPRLRRQRGNDSDGPPISAMRTALEAFIRTIEATGGCIRTSRMDVDPPDEVTIEFDDVRPVPAGDVEWADLAEAYLLACRAMRRQPVVRDADTNEFRHDGEG
jgi:hypothetical protein